MHLSSVAEHDCWQFVLRFSEHDQVRGPYRDERVRVHVTEGGGVRFAQLARQLGPCTTVGGSLEGARCRAPRTDSNRRSSSPVYSVDQLPVFQRHALHALTNGCDDN